MFREVDSSGGSVRDVDSSGGSVKKSLVQLCAERGLGISLTIKLICF